MVLLEEVRSRIAPEFAARFPGTGTDLLNDLIRVASLSDYFLGRTESDPSILQGLIEAGDLEAGYPDERPESLPAAVALDELDDTLRRVRTREMLRIIFRDLTRRASFEETTRDLSNLADACIQLALDTHYAALTERFGVPLGKDSGSPQQLITLALGKLGAGELNLSSDIDLIFLFDEAGSTDGEKQLTNQEFFVRLARAIIASLDKVTGSGFVFRVDMRLRPYGDSGALVASRAAMEKYYLEQGRDWERYAFIKARACAGDVATGRAFLASLVPFVFRRHLDYGAVEALREMKRLINYEVDVKHLNDDLKLGHGGIREVEFIVQACQLVWGGNEPWLREPRILVVLALLEEKGLLPAEDIGKLRAAYYFLRDSEHAIQAEADRQTQQLPESDLSKARLADAMGFADFDAYRHALDEHRGEVRASFNTFMSANNAERETLVEGNLFWVSIWQEPASPDSLALLANAGFESPEEVAARLETFERVLDESDVQDLGVSRIDRLMPIILSLTAREQSPTMTLNRMLSIVHSVARRSTYVAFLLENMDALKRTIHLCAMSPFIAEQLERFPILLYDLTDRISNDVAFAPERMREELLQLVQSVDAGDLEGHMDSLRQFRNSATLKVAVYELLDLLPIMKASDALTQIAEIVLDRAFDLAWNYLVDRHGEPCDREGERVGRSFAIIAYGKLGGIELGYGSDLDIVFLHDTDVYGRTDGERSIENSVFFSRLGQRIVHILTSMTRFGKAYELDLRLRPSGNTGPIVPSFTAFEKYLENDAWTWEHQALVRARFVAGNPSMKARFDAIREAQLGKRRDRSSLLDDVVRMREKMRRQLDKPVSGSGVDDVLISGFDLKQGSGAIVDIEFMVQYLVLAHACDHPSLAKWTDKIRILEEVRDLGLMADDDVTLLQQAYLAYRSAVHYQRLGGEMASYEHLQRFRGDVVDIWQRTMADGQGVGPAGGP